VARRQLKRVADKGLRSERIDAGWLFEDTYTVQGKRYQLVKGRELKISEAPRGALYRFHEAVTRPDGAVWLNIFGGPSGHGQWHSVAPTRVRWISRKMPR